MKVRHRADMPVNSNLIVRAPTGEDVMRMLRELHLPLLPQLYPPQVIPFGHAAASIAAGDLILNSLCGFIIEHYVTTKLAIEKRVRDPGCPTVCRKPR